MATALEDLKQILIEQEEQLGDMIYKTYCSAKESETYQALLDEGKELPKGIYQETVTLKDGDKTIRYYKYVCEQLAAEKWRGQKCVHEEFDDQDWRDYIAIRQYMELKTIRKCVVFFTVLAVIGIVAGLILGIILASAG